MQELVNHKNRFPGPHLQLILRSVEAGTTVARMWGLPQQDAESLVVLWEQGNYSIYIAGAPEGDGASALTNLFTETIIAAIRSQGRRYFKIRALDKKLHQKLPNLLSSVQFHPVQTRFYAFDQEQPNTAPFPVVEGLSIISIDRTLLHRADLAQREEVLDEIGGMWPSLDQFLAYGLGSVAIKDNAVVCWCTAEFASADRCGLGIATAPAYEGRGIATATAAHVVRAARQRGIVPHWECNSQNIGSQRVAEKVGFRLLDEEAYWLCSIDD